MKKVLALVVPILLTNSIMYSMKRSRPNTPNALVIEYGPSHKKVEIDPLNNQLLQRLHLARMNNMHIQKDIQKMGRPEVEIVDDKIVFE